MMHGRRLLESISSALGTAGEEGQAADAGKREKPAGASSGGEKAGAKAKPRRARHPGAAQKRFEPDETVDVDAEECPFCRSRHVSRGKGFSLHQVIDIMVRRLVKHFIVWDAVCGDCGRHFRAAPPPDALCGLGTGAAAGFSPGCAA